MQSEIVFENVWKTFPTSEKPTLAGLNLEIKKGSLHVLFGHSGAGKSVTLKHLLGLVPADEGTVLVAGENLSKLNDRGMRKLREKFGMLFQNSALFDSFTVFENIAFPLWEHRKDWDENRVQARVDELLTMVGLEGIGQKMPAELSGGMRKRVGLARAIALSPSILLFDEPTTGLDPETAQKIDDLIVKTVRTLNATALVISHDINAGLRIADFVSMLWGAKIVETATPADFVKSEVPVVRSFLRSAGINV
jgi:phospholipid/cholesterol/gamma-HCH transport system ATP-binding protein